MKYVKSHPTHVEDVLQISSPRAHLSPGIHYYYFLQASSIITLTTSAKVPPGAGGGEERKRRGEEKKGREKHINRTNLDNPKNIDTPNIGKESDRC